MKLHDFTKKSSLLVPKKLRQKHILASFVSFCLILVSVILLVRFDLEHIDKNNDGKITLNEVSVEFSYHKKWWRIMLAAITSSYVAIIGLAIYHEESAKRFN